MRPACETTGVARRTMLPMTPHPKISAAVATRGGRARRVAPARCGSLLAAVLAFAIAACDADVPTALVVAAESEAALQIAEELPALPWFISRIESSGSQMEPDTRRILSIASSLWEESLMTRAASPQLELRATVYDVAIPILAERVSHADLEAAHEALSRWLGLAADVVAEAGIGALNDRMVEGRRLTDRLAEMLGASEIDEVAALTTALRAADVLLETTPRLIALRLTAAAEALHAERADASSSRVNAMDPIDLARAERLLRGAREALARRDYTLAIRRAFYARQLLDPTCSAIC